MKPQKIQNEFLRLCRGYADSVEPFGTAEEKEKKACAFSLIFRSTKLQLVYRPKDSMGLAPSTLYCRVYPDKNSPIYLHLPQLLPLLEIEDYRACYFPYIETSQRMAHCFRALTAFLEELLPALEKLGSTGGDQELLKRFILESGIKDVEPEAILKNGSADQKVFLMILRMEETSHVARYTEFDAWYNYLLGQPLNALSKYRKRKDLTAYEQGLCRFLETPEGQGFVPILPECFALRDKNEVSGTKTGFVTGLKCGILLYLICAAVGCLLLGIMQIISSFGTVCWFGVSWYYGFVLGGLPAVFGTIALRRKLIPLVSRKNSRKQLDFDEIMNDSPVVDGIAMGLFLLLAVGAIVFGVALGSQALRLYDGYGDYWTGYFSREEFRYGQIDAVYHINARYNVYGDRIERDSYVIALENGMLIDLDGYTTPRQTEKKVLPIFQEIGIEVTELDSDQDLPGEL